MNAFFYKLRFYVKNLFVLKNECLFRCSCLIFSVVIYVLVLQTILMALWIFKSNISSIPFFLQLLYVFTVWVFAFLLAVLMIGIAFDNQLWLITKKPYFKLCKPGITKIYRIETASSIGRYKMSFYENLVAYSHYEKLLIKNKANNKKTIVKRL